MNYTEAQLKARSRLLSKYLIDGRPMTNEDYARKFAEQNGGCAICGAPPRGGISLAVDHSHRRPDYKVRGLLCMTCNRRVLGRIERWRRDPRKIVLYFEKYDPDYLKQFDK